MHPLVGHDPMGEDIKKPFPVISTRKGIFQALNLYQR